MSSPLHVVLAADDGYALPLSVALRSLIDQRANRNMIRAHVIDGGLSTASKAKIRASVPELQQLDFVRPKTNALYKLPLPRHSRVQHLNHSMYLRLLIPSLLPETERRVLYLDADVLVRNDLDAIWESDMEGCPVAAVQDGYIPSVSAPMGLAAFAELGLSASTKYFNSGLLLLDLELWRTEDLSRRAIEYMTTTDSLLNADQEALNVAVGGRWKELHKTWNVLVGQAEPGRLPWYPEAKLFHFVGPDKPWQKDYPHQHYKDIYCASMQRTSWFDSTLA